ncbi:GAF domain-containing protein [Chryseomicrobium imtechense]
MGQTIAVLHIDRSKKLLSPLLDRSSLFSHLTEDEESIIWDKSNTSDFSPFQLVLHHGLYEIVMGTTPSGNHFAVFTAHEEKALRSLFEIESTMRNQQMKLFELAKSRTITKESLKETIESACETIAQLIQVERVGIWLFNTSQSILEAQNIYDARYAEHLVGDKVDDIHYPTYFEAVQSARSLAIHDVATDPRVAEMYPSYFEGMGGILGACHHLPAVPIWCLSPILSGRSSDKCLIYSTLTTIYSTESDFSSTEVILWKLFILGACHHLPAVPIWCLSPEINRNKPLTTRKKKTATTQKES